METTRINLTLDREYHESLKSLSKSLKVPVTYIIQGMIGEGLRMYAQTGAFTLNAAPTLTPEQIKALDDAVDVPKTTSTATPRPVEVFADDSDDDGWTREQRVFLDAGFTVAEMRRAMA